MNVNVNDITITSLETIQAFHVTTGAYLFTLDELQSATISQTQEKQDITGKQGRKLSSLKKNKAVTISGNNGMVSCGLLEMQTGSSFATKTTEVQWTDYLSIRDDAATTSYVAHGATGAEIEELWIKNSDGTLNVKLEQDATAAEGKFAYDPSTKALSFLADAYEDGTELVVFYKRQISAPVLENHSDTYSSKCTLYIDAIGEDKCANVYHVQFYIPKADFNGEFSFEMGDNQTVHSFEAEALAGACGTGGVLWTYTVFGANTPDVAD